MTTRSSPGRRGRLRSGRRGSQPGAGAVDTLRMWAIVMHEFGPPSVLVCEEVPDPVTGPQQVVVDVDVASITFVETQVRVGRPHNRRCCRCCRPFWATAGAAWPPPCAGWG